MSIRIDRVYTRSGDDGQTGLVGGGRVSKAGAQVRLYGEIDELNSVLGVVRACCTVKTAQLEAELAQLQQELFDVGAQAASPPDSIPDSMWRVDAEAIARLERLCDQFGAELPALRSFVIPGGSMLAAQLHVARAVCRRAERGAVGLRSEQQSAASPQLAVEIVHYLNRLSDLLFVFARWALVREGKDSPLWVPAPDRKPA